MTYSGFGWGDVVIWLSVNNLAATATAIALAVAVAVAVAVSVPLSLWL